MTLQLPISLTPINLPSLCKSLHMHLSRAFGPLWGCGPSRGHCPAPSRQSLAYSGQPLSIPDCQGSCPSSSSRPHLRPAIPTFVQPSPPSSGRPHLRPAVPTFVRPSSDRTTHIVRSIRLDPPDLTGLSLILSHGLSYASIILLYLVLSILLDYTSTSNLHP